MTHSATIRHSHLISLSAPVSESPRGTLSQHRTKQVRFDDPGGVGKTLRPEKICIEQVGVDVKEVLGKM